MENRNITISHNITEGNFIEIIRLLGNQEITTTRLKQIYYQARLNSLDENCDEKLEMELNLKYFHSLLEDFDDDEVIFTEEDIIEYEKEKQEQQEKNHKN